MKEFKVECVRADGSTIVFFVEATNIIDIMRGLDMVELIHPNDIKITITQQ